MWKIAFVGDYIYFDGCGVLLKLVELYMLMTSVLVDVKVIL